MKMARGKAPKTWRNLCNDRGMYKLAVFTTLSFLITLPAFAVKQNYNIRAGAGLKSRVVSNTSFGNFRATGKIQGVWREVVDENGNRGWVNRKALGTTEKSLPVSEPQPLVAAPAPSPKEEPKSILGNVTEISKSAPREEQHPQQVSAESAQEQGPAKSQVDPDSDTKVIFFGGFRATAAQMKCWADGVTIPNADVTAIPYPAGATYKQNRAIERMGMYQSLKKEIQANPNRKFEVAGHSSGSQYANQLVEWMLQNGVPAENIHLVNLDGFRAPPSLQSKVKTDCWSASSGRLQSNNFKSECKRFQAPTCRTQWCLHFSLVNKEAPSNLQGGSDFVQRGYDKKNCQTNVDWIGTGDQGQKVSKQSAKRDVGRN